MKFFTRFSRISFTFLGMAYFVLLSPPNLALAKEFKIDQQELIQETQKHSQDAEKITFVWWLAQPFWELSLSESMKGKDLENMVKVFEPYIIVGVVDGTMGPFGGLATLPEEVVRENIFMVNDDGDKYPPVATGVVNRDLNNMLLMMKPIFSNMLGQFGEGLNFFVFNAMDPEGGKLYDVRSAGRLNIIVGKEDFVWRLPLATLFPKKNCSKCGEELQGNYQYCPWDGTKL